MHIVVVDDLGTVTGVRGSILEKHLGLSKAKGFHFFFKCSSEKLLYNNYIDFSENIYCGGKSINKVATSFSTGYTPSSAEWGEDAQGSVFKSAGNLSFTFSGGEDYSSDGGMDATLSDLMNSYSLFLDEAISLDFVIMGPGLIDRFESQAKANYIISIAEHERKDCMAVIGPHYSDLVGQSNSDTQTDNLISYFGSIASSSYAVFDSGYKYTYNRFANKFCYIACNPDIAESCLEQILTHSHGSLLQERIEELSIMQSKLAYNPSKTDRDRLYPNRINPVVTQTGKGTFLFGDKTALAYPSAFDRINVRRLFLTIEQALEGAAQSQLFELNDDVTRSGFINIVEPFLRDVQAKED